MKEEEIDIMSYQYEPGQTVQLEGNVMLLIARFLADVAQKEKMVFSSFVYPKKVHETRNENGELIKVNFDWEEHNKTSFMLTAFEEDGAQVGLTATGVKATQILSGLLNIHEQNVELGIAKTEATLNEERAFKS